MELGLFENERFTATDFVNLRRKRLTVAMILRRKRKSPRLLSRITIVRKIRKRETVILLWSLSAVSYDRSSATILTRLSIITTFERWQDDKAKIRRSAHDQVSSWIGGSNQISLAFFLLTATREGFSRLAERFPTFCRWTDSFPTINNLSSLIRYRKRTTRREIHCCRSDLDGLKVALSSCEIPSIPSKLGLRLQRRE